MIRDPDVDHMSVLVYIPGVTCFHDVSVALACVRRSAVDGHVKRRLHGRLVQTREHLTGVG